MDKTLLIELIKITPTLVFYLVILIVFLLYRKPFVEGVLPKISGFKAFGIEASFVREGLEGAMKAGRSTNVQVSSSLMQRISHYPRRPLRVLWIDDNPDTVMYESGVIQNLGMLVEFAKTSANAMERLEREKFQILVSDIRRGEKSTEGLDFMARMRAAQMNQPVVFYVSELDRTKGVPPGAFGITDDPNELIHLVLDVAERL
ncbi:MAG: response regulator [Saprospiraceae bacterium]|nr:response regulator [Saprospiraceae bacterium]